METTSYTITTTTTPSSITYSTISLSAQEVENAMQGSQPDTESALRSAVRSGLFSPITASASDTVAVEIRPDGTAEIVVVAKVIGTTTITVSEQANSSS